ncbi:MAG: Threonylcarbamoyladenosine tRNA methylthiotransferase MtaB [Planctomycetes bacterium ADurb.Bin401]|nr:MAG: Threonylcarbamoyladenosine tRNA methylthiotransferase MtaB [Planctomycetes bacterium ADurb.Bin401]
MQTFAINTLGCKVNQYESQQIIQFLTDCNLLYVQRFESAEIIIIHTCCVTKTASAKSRQLVHKAQKLNPNAKIIVSGCLLKSELKEFESLKDKALFAPNINELFILLKKELNIIKPLPNRGLQKFCGQTRAFLKVQDGCDGYCSYCIIPTTRPNITFKPLQDIIAETQDLVKSGHKEIILTGIFLGAYGQNTVKRKKWPDNENPLLAEMVDKVAQVPYVKRIRLSSLEPGDVTCRLLEVMKNHPNIMPHLHLSLQSGSDRILKKMNRQYTVKDFLNSIENINLQLDRPAITTDIIVGFPGETTQDFAQSLSVARLAGFSKIHIFPFSKRAGTAAAKLQDQINKEVITERTKQLRELEKQLAINFRRQFIGQTAEVLIESDIKNTGKCERYYEITVQTDAILHQGEIVKCIINEDAVTASIR